MRVIKGFPKYSVDRNGEVWSMMTLSNRQPPALPRKLSKYKMLGYWQVTLMKHGRNCKRLIHSLVLEAYVGKRPKGYQCRHLNGKRNDNRLENLRWGTRSENQMDRVRHGTDNRGERHGMSKYTKIDVVKIRELCKIHQQKDVAKMLNMPKSTVSCIARGASWGHVPNPPVKNI